jgi:large subunit ribosomal protein L16
VAVIRPGKILFEMEGVTREIAEGGDAAGAHKLPMRTKFVTREHSGLENEHEDATG